MTEGNSLYSPNDTGVLLLQVFKFGEDIVSDNPSMFLKVVFFDYIQNGISNGHGYGVTPIL